MKPHFNSEMITMGVLSIVVGIAASIENMFYALEDGVFAASGTLSNPTIASPGFIAGSTFAVFGLLALCCQAGLIVAGGGVIRFAWWARRLSIACGGGLAVVNLVLLVAVFDEFHVVSMLVLVYGALLAFVCCTPQWRATFRRGPLEATS